MRKLVGVMGWIDDCGVRFKFAMVIALMGLVSAAVSVTAWVGMQRMQDRSEAIYSRSLLPLQSLAKVQTAALSIRTAVLNAGMSSTSDGAQAFVAQVHEQDGALDAAVAAYRSQTDTTSPAGVQRARLLAAVTDGVAAYRKVRDEVLLPAAVKHDIRAYEQARDQQGIPAYAKVSAALDELTGMETTAAHQANTDAKATAVSARRTLLLFVLLGLALGTTLGMVIASRLITPLRQVAAVLHGVADGDLTQSTGLGHRDEVGTMAAALDTTITALRDSVTVVNTNSHTLAGAAEELAAVNATITADASRTATETSTVSAATEQISRSVTSVSAAAEQLSASIAEIAVTAGKAAQITTTAGELALDGTLAMTSLGESSNEIGNVLSMITSIAEQTNLLALNATIEAARAGEAGKGFAVVASEVKDLAQATSAATQDVSQRIEAIQRDARAAVTAITKIAEVITEMGGYATTIASAVEEQAAVTQEINQTVTEAAAGTTHIHASLTTVTSAATNTTTGITEASRASQELATLSTHLQQAVAHFTT